MQIGSIYHIFNSPCGKYRHLLHSPKFIFKRHRKRLAEHRSRVKVIWVWVTKGHILLPLLTLCSMSSPLIVSKEGAAYHEYEWQNLP